MNFPRSAGILLHISSLPGGHGIGDLGASARHFADFLAASGQRLWQVLPVGPTGFGDSPYQCFSAFAGNPLLIDLAAVREENPVASQPLSDGNLNLTGSVDYGSVIRFKLSALRQAAETFFALRSHPDHLTFVEFCDANATWLDDYALFMACKQAHGGAVWTEWDSALSRHEEAAVNIWSSRLAGEIQIWKYWQFQFFRQWDELKSYCHRSDIRIMGDIPMYVAHDSADVWAHPELFRLNEHGHPSSVAGVPPDYFSATGQLWGNPVYRWDVAAVSGYAWWIARFRMALRLFDLVRIDHFRGFQAFWEIPAEAATAVEGKWSKGPGALIFQALEDALGALPIVAENLGVITDDVEAIRHQFRFPGMSVLQFAFGTDPQAASFRPHNYPRDLVAYTGGHDNDTTVGWWTSSGATDSTRRFDEVEREREFARSYLGVEKDAIHWVMIRALLASVANVAIIPLQDVLGLGSEARMNLPGSITGNWKWRYRSGVLTEQLAFRLRTLTQLYDR